MAKGSFPYVPYGNHLYNLVERPSAPDDEAYFAALGRFIASYASAEHSVHTVARKLSRLTDAKARIIFGGMRLGDLTERIRGLLRATRASDKKYNEIDACLIQLDLISEQRNKLVHRWVSYHDGLIWVSNITIAKVIGSSETISLRMSDFTNMNADCSAISYRLQFHGRVGDPSLLKWARSPWRYKPAQPDAGQKPRHKAPQSPKRQPLSSRERREAAMKKREN
jgi:hypothetical protein